MSTIKQANNYADCILLSSIEHRPDELLSMKAEY